MFAERLGPTNTLCTSRVVFEAEQCKAIAFLCRSNLKVVHDAANANSISVHKSWKVDGPHRVHLPEQINIVLERMPRNEETKRVLFRDKQLRASPWVANRRKLLNFRTLIVIAAKKSILTKRVCFPGLLRTRKSRVDDCVQLTPPLCCWTRTGLN